MWFMLFLASGLDRLNEWIGRVVLWLTLAMVLIGSYNALVRYLDRYSGLGLSSNMYLELQWYMFSVVFLLGAAYTLKHHAHVRVDVLYTHLSPRGKAWINVLGTILFLLPFCTLMLWTSWPTVRDSWALLEMSPDPGGLPRYPIKTIIPIAFGLLFLQGLSLLIHELAILLGYEDTEETQTGGGETG